MAKKRGLAANRGLDALLGSIKKEKAITEVALQDDLFNKALLDSNDEQESARSIKASTTPKKTNKKSIKANNDAHLKDSKPKKPATKDVVNNKSSSIAPTSNLANGNAALDKDMSLVQIDVEHLQAGKYQPRRDMSETALSELASSIRQHGVMQPIVIRPLLSGEEKKSNSVTHEIIAGERRWRAAKMADQATIPAIERALSDELAIALALIENIQREDLSVIEQAAALQRFHTEFGMSHAMIADVVGKARTTVSNLLRLNHLNDSVKTYLSDGDIDMGHARALLSLSSEQQPIIAKKIIDATMTVREAEKLVKSILHPENQTKTVKERDDKEIEALNQKLSDHLGAKVKLKQKKDGKGSMEIFFYSPDELDEILKHFK